MTESPSVTLGERRRRYVASEISDAAMQLFAERGFDTVTVDEIAAAAGISSRTFFRYFASKDDVVLQYRRRLQTRMVAELTGRPASEGAVTALRNTYLETSTTPPANRAAVALRSRVLFETPTLRARAEGEGIERDGPVVAELAARMGVPIGDMRPLALARAMSAVAGTAFEEWARAGGRGDPAAHLHDALDLVVDGFGGLDTPPTE